MTISIVASEIEDSQESIHVSLAAFQTDALSKALYNLDTALPHDLADFLQWRLLIQQTRMQNPSAHYFKAVDDETGELVGLTGWYDPSYVPASVDSFTFPKRMNRILEKELREKMEVMKGRYLAGRDDVWYVQSMFVHPDYQGRGIAAKLLQMGLDKANRAGQDVYLEATPSGLPLYKKLGFEVLDVIHLTTVEYKFHVMMHRAR